MTSNELKNRLKHFTFQCIDILDFLPKNTLSFVISKQLIRSSLSVAANYRAATRAQSKKQFLSKLNIALEEMDESLFWLEIIQERALIENNNLNLLINEADQLVRILSATKNTTIKNLQATIPQS